MLPRLKIIKVINNYTYSNNFKNSYNASIEFEKKFVENLYD